MSSDESHSRGNNSSGYSDEQESEANGYYTRPASSPVLSDDDDAEEEEGEKTKPISALRAKRIRPPPDDHDHEHDDASPSSSRKKAACASSNGGPVPAQNVSAKSQVNIDELMAATYAKGFSILNQKHNASAASGSASGLHNKSGKKAEKAPGESKKPPGWTPHDEMTLAKVLISCSSGGQVQMAPFYERAHEALPETSNSQVYDKMRRMRSRFWQIQTQLREGAIPEERFPFRNPHEAKLYVIWKQIWGDDSDRCRNGNGNGHGAPSASANHRAEDDGPVRRAPSHAEKQNIVPDIISDDDAEHLLSNANASSSFGRVLAAQVRNCVQSAMEDSLSKVEGFVNNRNGASSSAGLGFGLEFGYLSKKMREIADSTKFGNSYAGLDGPDGRSIRQKWRRLQIDELRLFSSRLELLQDEVRFHLKRLENNAQFL
eukprot:TRINITY_DN4854_c0_g1_i1.p1 TRINITY_DN4854_c0_g1~~TRINITY_DN4854_c0_g1_i1.p1  ORF type:complete len:432 (+),score=-3.60 TRINITY_DN4854_c0_g1_i1:452-1747(+)